MAVINIFVSIITFSMDTFPEVIPISGIPIEPNRIDTYQRKIGDTEITVKNISPNFKTDEDRLNAKSQIMQILYEVFSKYDENC